jgi:Phage tail tube protein
VFGKEDVSLLVGKQSAFGTQAATPKFYQVPRQAAANVEHSRSKISSTAVYRDGYKRKFALGNHKSTGSLPLVPNLEFLFVPLRGVTGGVTAGAAVGGLTPYTFDLTKNVLYHTWEVGFGDELFYRHTDHVFNHLAFKIPVEGEFTLDLATEGSGDLQKNATSIDPAAAELIGNTCEYANMTILQDGLDSGDISDLSVTIERKLLIKRPHNRGGKASELRFGGTEVTGELTAYFDSEARWEKALNAELIALSAKLVDGAKFFQIGLPEVQLEPKGPALDGEDGLLQKFTFEAVVHAGTAPVNLALNIATPAVSWS